MIYPKINFDRSERVSYDRPDFLVYIRKGTLSSYPNYSAESHWHDDAEFILILAGSMQYNINGEIVTLERGEGIFVNARQFHFGYSANKKECVFVCVLLHPIALCASRGIEEKFVQPILRNEQIPFYRFTQKNEWEKRVLDAIKEMYDVREDKAFELKIQRTFYEIWIELYENAISIETKHDFQSHHLFALREMISFLHKNFKEKLTLNRIASAGKVSKTGCCAIFKRYTNKTPNNFLIDLRLRKAVELLSDTDMTISEISYEVGFSGASYFTETFHENYGCTPSEYRKNT